MDLPDINILITAFRSDTEHHRLIKEWLEEQLNTGYPIRLSPIVEAGFLRIVTHPQIFKQPSSMTQAARFIEELVKAPSVATIVWGPALRTRWLKLCRDQKLQGNDCNDAMLAAIALERNLRLVSFDRGFSRFTRLRYWNPSV